MSLWTRLAHLLLDHPRPFVAVIVIVTVVLGYWTHQVKIDHTAGNFASQESQAMEDFRRAGEVFGKSETILYVVFHGVDPYEPAFLSELATLSEEVASEAGVEHVLSLANAPYLSRSGAGLIPDTLVHPGLEAEEIRARIGDQPFFTGLLVGAEGRATAMLVKVDEAFNSTRERIGLVDRIEAAAQQMPGEVALAGFPYLRTQYTKRVSAESPLFTLLALFISLIFLFLTFRAWRAVLLPTAIVLLGIVWTFGLMTLFGQPVNIVTAILPALIVIIGMANAIHLTTKFFDQFALYRDRRRALVQTIHTVGLATFLTGLTTAVGFAVLALSGSDLLIGFGIFAAVGIMFLYFLSVTLIPIAYLKMPPPSLSSSAPAVHDRYSDFFDRLGGFTRRRSLGIIAGSTVVVALAILGAARISTDIYVFSDFQEKDPVRLNLAVFEEHFGGILPLEVVISSKTPGQFRSLANLRRIEALEDDLAALKPVGTSLSAAGLVKMANQAFFGGHPATYRLPSSYELPFLQTALDGLLEMEDDEATRNLPLFVDSTYSITRIFAGVSDIGTTRMNQVVDTVMSRATAMFPADRYDVIVTGSAVMSTRSGESLVRNLIVSLGVALLVISVLMAILFRSARLTLISLIPNMIPLLLVGGTMGLVGIALKPSTALIFSLAFGIAVDDTIHFLAKFRLLQNSALSKDEVIRKTLRETGKAIFFTSLVLMSGFLVFTLSGFGGTVSMGALTAFTLGVALVTNLLLLPALLYRYGPEMG
jgi:uncharacterized protein